MDIQFSLNDETSEFLHQIIKLEAIMKGSLTDESVSDLLMEMFKKGMSSVHDEQLNVFSKNLENDLDKVFENIEAGHGGIVWLSDFGSVMEIPIC